METTEAEVVSINKGEAPMEAEVVSIESTEPEVVSIKSTESTDAEVVSVESTEVMHATPVAAAHPHAVASEAATECRRTGRHGRRAYR